MRVGDHRPVADEDHPFDPEPLADGVDHAGHGARVGGVARVHLHRYRPSFWRAHKPPVDLQLSRLAIAAVTERRQRAAAALHIARGEVVEHEGALLEMPARERVLDPLLALCQPVHHRQQLGLFDLAERQLVGQRGLRKAAGHRQLRGGRDHQLTDHRHRQIPLAAPLPRDQPLQVQVSEHPQYPGHVPVRQRALDLQLLVEIDQHPACEHLADRVDHLNRQVREVPQVLVADLPALPVGAAQQVGRVHRPALPLRPDCGYVSLTATTRHSRHPSRLAGQNQDITLATSNRQNKARSRKHGRSGQTKNPARR